MSIAFSQQSFIINALTSIHTPIPRKFLIPLNSQEISCGYQSDDPKDSSRKNENQLAKLAVVTLAAGVLTLGSVDPASAAKTGGRVGGQAFRSPAPRSSGPRINNSRVEESNVSNMGSNCTEKGAAVLTGPMFISILQLPLH
ncbi:hypothetical protein U1Q18_026579 [Sarracenia purpurea var. burkii]